MNSLQKVSIRNTNEQLNGLKIIDLQVLNWTDIEKILMGDSKDNFKATPPPDPMDDM